MGEWEQLLAELPEDIAEEFRVFVGEDNSRKQMLLANYRAKKEAFDRGDSDGFVNIIERERWKNCLYES